MTPVEALTPVTPEAEQLGPAIVRVLMVDDNPANLLTLEVVLEPLGHVLVRATSGEEALQRLREDDYALVLMDVRMPGLDGLQAAALMKQRARSRRTPIILVSALTNDRADVLRGYHHGAVDYLFKPLDPDVLRTKVSVFVDLYLKAHDVERQAVALRAQWKVGEALRASILAEQNARHVAEASERSYRALAETMPQMCWASNPDGRVVYYNQRWLDYTGQTLEEALGPNRRRVHHPDFFAAVTAAWQACLISGEPFEAEAPLERVDGVYRLHLLRATAQRDQHGNIDKWFGTCTDVHDQRQLVAERLRLEQREREMQHVALRADVSASLSANEDLETMLAGCCRALVLHLGATLARIWTLAPSGDLLQLRASAGRHGETAGPHAQVPVGSRAVSPIALIAEERTPRLTNELLEAERLGEREWAKAEGLSAFAGYPLLIADRVVGVVAMFADHDLDQRALTAIETVASTLAQGIERKRAEEALDLRAAELSRSNAELERFAYVASHDLQEPLRMVASYTQLLARRYKGRLDSDADEFIAFAVDGANRMQTLINDLLAFSRAGTRAVDTAAVPLEKPLSAALANLRVAIEESGATVTHDPLPTVLADNQQLTQLLQNLIGNAIKFRGAEPPRIHLSVEANGDEWKMALRDNGIGIEPKFFDRLFVLFQRLHSRSEYSGNGIGLAICKRIVERHGGQIWVDSVAGQGSTFTFTLRGAIA